MSAKSGLQQPNLGTLNKCVGRECQTGHVRIDFAGAGMNRNAPAFYCVPAKAFEALMDKLEEMELNSIANARLKDGKPLVRVKLDDL